MFCGVPASTLSQIVQCHIIRDTYISIHIHMLVYVMRSLSPDKRSVTINFDLTEHTAWHVPSPHIYYMTYRDGSKTRISHTHNKPIKKLNYTKPGARITQTPAKSKNCVESHRAPYYLSIFDKSSFKSNSNIGCGNHCTCTNARIYHANMTMNAMLCPRATRPSFTIVL